MDTEQLTRDGLAAIEGAASSAELEDVRVSLVGRRAPLTLALRELGSLPPEERGARGKTLNSARVALEGALERRAPRAARCRARAAAARATGST